MTPENLVRLGRVCPAALRWVCDNPYLTCHDRASEFAAEHMMALARSREGHRRTVVIVTPHGSYVKGVVAMRPPGYDHVVLDCGGRHGTPGIADVRNIVWISGFSPQAGKPARKRRMIVVEK